MIDKILYNFDTVSATDNSNDSIISDGLQKLQSQVLPTVNIIFGILTAICAISLLVWIVILRFKKAKTEDQGRRAMLDKMTYGAIAVFIIILIGWAIAGAIVTMMIHSAQSGMTGIGSAIGGITGRNN